MALAFVLGSRLDHLVLSRLQDAAVHREVVAEVTWGEEGRRSGLRFLVDRLGIRQRANRIFCALRYRRILPVRYFCMVLSNHQVGQRSPAEARGA